MEESTTESPAEHSMADMFLALTVINDNINRSRDQQISTINELRNDVNGKFEAMDFKVNGIDGKLSQAGNDITMLKAKINEIEQEKLAARMEITGIDKAEIAANKRDPASLAVKVISSFNIEINRNAIQLAYVREWIQRNISILVVEFTSVEHKIDIMKKKRAAKETKNIFFDHAMTPATRVLFVQAKKKAKEIKARFAFISHGKVFISIDINKKVQINSADDLKSISAPSATPISNVASSSTANQ